MDALHNRLNILKETSSENDRLLGKFTAERISEVTQSKSEIIKYANQTEELLNKTNETTSMLIKILSKLFFRYYV